MFNNLNVPQQNVEQERDTLGSSVYDSGLYKARIEQAYGTVSKNGAKGVVLKMSLLKSDGSILPFTNTFYVTNREGSVTFTSRDGKTHYLPAFNQINSLCNVLLGKDLMQVATEQRTLPVYNVEQKAEVPTAVEAVPELFGKEFVIGLIKTRENKTELVDGSYVPTAEEIFRNNVDKFFFLKDGKVFTSNEIKANAEPAFAAEWANKWEGKVQDKYKAVSGTSSSSGATTQPLNIG